jgi:hypothetical protein
MMQHKWKFLFIFCCLLVAGCLNDGKQLAGNGSEVENGLSGIVYSSDAARVSGAVVTLYPSDFNPFTDSDVVLDRDTTDEKGRYSFATRPTRPYHIDARLKERNLSALVLHPKADTLILSESGSITLDVEGATTEFFIPGTSIRSAPGSSVLSAIPAGIFTVLSRSRDTLALDIPVSARHSTGVPSRIIKASRDTYLESSEPDQNVGARQYLRLKSGDQGILLVHFDLDSVATLDSATLWMAVSEFQRDFIDYSYDASLFGFTAPWVEGTGYDKADIDNGSTYRESEPGIPWPAGFPGASIDSASRIDVSFRGVRGEQIKHPFPVSGAILRGLKSGAYTAIAIVENSNRYNNADFSSAEGYMPPELYLYRKE